MVYFLVTFVHTNWMQKDLELYLPFKVDSPLYKSKKNILIIGSMVLKTTGLISWFQRKNLENEPIYATNLCRQTKPSYFGTFLAISLDPVHIFQKRFLR